MMRPSKNRPWKLWDRMGHSVSACFGDSPVNLYEANIADFIMAPGGKSLTDALKDVKTFIVTISVAMATTFP